MCMIMTDRGWQQLGDGVVCVNHNKIEGVFHAQTLSEAQTITALHAEHYVKSAEKFLNGEYPGTGNERWNAMKYDISRFHLYGAFGERL